MNNSWPGLRISQGGRSYLDKVSSQEIRDLIKTVMVMDHWWWGGGGSSHNLTFYYTKKKMVPEHVSQKWGGNIWSIWSFKKILKFWFPVVHFLGKSRKYSGNLLELSPLLKGVGLEVPIFLQKRHIWAKTNRQELIGRRRREGGREASSSSPCWPPPPSGRCSPLNETSACQLVLIHTLIDTWLMVGYWWEQMCSITPLESYQSSSENYSKQTQHVYIEMCQLI